MPPKKKIAALVKVQIQAGAATPAPPVGTALGPHGVNIMDFCKAYNAQTEAKRGNVIPVEITIYEDRSFTFVTKTPPAAELIKKAAGVAKGSGVPQKDKVGKLTKDQVREIATTKLPDLNANDIDAAMKIIEGTARSMGINTDLSIPAYGSAHTTRGRAALAHLDHNSSKDRGTDMQRSKTYRAAAETFDQDKLHAPLAAIRSPRAARRRSSTRPSRWPCASASTRARPTRWSAAP